MKVLLFCRTNDIISGIVFGRSVYLWDRDITTFCVVVGVCSGSFLTVFFLLLTTGRMTVRLNSVSETDSRPVAPSQSAQPRSPPRKKLRLSLRGQKILGSTSHSTTSEYRSLIYTFDQLLTLIILLQHSLPGQTHH